jgi:hypothetical protein
MSNLGIADPGYLATVSHYTQDRKLRLTKAISLSYILKSKPPIRFFSTEEICTIENHTLISF